MERSRTGSFRNSKHLSAPGRRCCCCLSLQTGTTLIVIGDILFFFVVLTFFSMELTQQMVDYQVLHINRAPNAVYWAFTGGLVGLFLFLKCYYGVIFLWTSTGWYRRKHIHDNIIKKRKGRVLRCAQDCEAVDEEDEQLRQRAQKTVVKMQRNELSNFFIASTVYYIFLIILCACLIPIEIVIWRAEIQIARYVNVSSFMVLFTGVSTGSLIYALKRINWLIIYIIGMPLKMLCLLYFIQC